MSESSTVLTTPRFGLQTGTPAIQSVGPISFGPEGILFLADNASATIFAIDLGPTEAPATVRPLDIDQLDTRLAALLGCAREDVSIRDMAVHPVSQQVYLSVMRGSGDAAVPVLLTAGSEGALAVVELENVPFAQTAIQDAPSADDERLETQVVRGKGEGQEYKLPKGGSLWVSRKPLRSATVTDLAYVDGMLLVAGASNEEFSSTLRRIPFPFTGDAVSNSVEIFHVSHGKYETASPIRTFVPFGGNTSILASYTCTPVVQISLGDMAAGTKVEGRTVAELGAGNTPVDMLAYAHDGEEYLLVSNSRHPLFKIACKDIGPQEPLTQPREPIGVPRETLSHQGVGQMANLNGSYVLMLQQDEGGSTHLHSYSSATL